MILTKNYPSGKSIDHALNELFNSFPSACAPEQRHSMVQVNINESDAGFHLEFNAPGRNKEDFKINLESTLLTVRYEKAVEVNEKVKPVRKEFSLTTFKRSFSIDENKVNAEAIEAKYDNGILNIFIPKKEEVKNSPKQISIQ